MNWWKQWKWFKKQGIGGWYFYDHDISTYTHFYYRDGDNKIKMGKLHIRRNWIEKI